MPHSRITKRVDSEGGLVPRCGAFFVIVNHVVDPSAHGIAPHQPGIAGFQQFGRRTHAGHSRIEPQVVTIWIKNDWHAVVDG